MSTVIGAVAHPGGSSFRIVLCWFNCSALYIPTLIFYGMYDFDHRGSLQGLRVCSWQSPQEQDPHRSFSEGDLGGIWACLWFIIIVQNLPLALGTLYNPTVPFTTNPVFYSSNKPHFLSTLLLFSSLSPCFSNLFIFSSSHFLTKY